MGRAANRLTAMTVAKLTTPGRYCDGLGLWLQVTETENGDRVTKAWLFRYMRHGRARQMGLGALHTVSLAEARERARQARQILLDGDDPLEIKRQKRDEARAETAQRILFKNAAERFLELHENTWRNAKHKEQWRNSLKELRLPDSGGAADLGNRRRCHHRDVGANLDQKVRDGAACKATHRTRHSVGSRW